MEIEYIEFQSEVGQVNPYFRVERFSTFEEEKLNSAPYPGMPTRNTVFQKD